MEQQTVPGWGGGGSQFFLVGTVCVAQVFQSRVYRFFRQKTGVLELIFAKISVFGAEILPKSERNGP